MKLKSFTKLTQITYCFQDTDFTGKESTLQARQAFCSPNKIYGIFHGLEEAMYQSLIRKSSWESLRPISRSIVSLEPQNGKYKAKNGRLKFIKQKASPIKNATFRWLCTYQMSWAFNWFSSTVLTWKKWSAFNHWHLAQDGTFLFNPMTKKINPLLPSLRFINLSLPGVNRYQFACLKTNLWQGRTFLNKWVSEECFHQAKNKFNTTNSTSTPRFYTNSLLKPLCHQLNNWSRSNS